MDDVMHDDSSNAESERRTREFLSAMTGSLDISPTFASKVDFTGRGELPSIFPVSDFAAAAVATAAAAAGELINAIRGVVPAIRVSRPLASLWFGSSVRPVGWTLPPLWDPIAGNYRGKDGWIRLHTNAPHHRAAALAVLRVEADKTTVSRAVAAWEIEALESAGVEEKGCASALRSTAAWSRHPQGRCVSGEPLIAMRTTPDRGSPARSLTPRRPLAGVRILDLTRVLAGPVATRFLSGLGADVLRIDPPDWDEPGVIPDVALGKRCARLDLHDPRDRAVLLELLRDADVLVHGYRSDALDRLELGAELRRQIRPGLVDIALDAYGWSGPWRTRRGFDSPRADEHRDRRGGHQNAGQGSAGATARPGDRPRDRLSPGRRDASWAHGARPNGPGFRGAGLARADGAVADRRTAARWFGRDDWSEDPESTAFGTARRLKSPVTIDDEPLRWDRPAARLGSSPPVW